MRKFNAVLLLVALLLTLTGCQKTPAVNGPAITDIPAGVLLDADKRPQVLPFQGTDLMTKQNVDFTQDGAGRVRLISFFSPT